VLERVLRRTSLQGAADRDDDVLRRGITLVPRHGVRVRQPRAPSPRLDMPTVAEPARVG
jgi:hypothetical protein